MIRLRTFLFLLFIATTISYSFACTGIRVLQDDDIFHGNNCDYSDPATYMTVNRGNGGGFDRIVFGYTYMYPQSGINEHGLSFGCFSTANNPVISNPNLPQLVGNYFDEILASCTNISEVVDFFNSHNRQIMNDHQLFFVDIEGNSIIVEGDSILSPVNDYQICTNFYQTDYPTLPSPCWRFNTASNMIAESDSFSVERVRDIQDACHQTGQNITQYTTIYNNNNLEFYLYHQSNFDQVVQFTFSEVINSNITQQPIADFFASSVELEENSVPQQFELYSNYPNPFNSTTTFSFYLPQKSDISLEIFDIQGRFIETIINEFKDAGNYNVPWNSGDNPSGTYMVRLRSGEQQLSKKCVLLK
jgi:Secretion system C-terminal sorting domain